MSPVQIVSGVSSYFWQFCIRQRGVWKGEEFLTFIVMGVFHYSS